MTFFIKKESGQKQPRKVFYMVYSLTSGGIERYSINLYKNINRQKYIFDFITKLDRQEFFDKDLQNMNGIKISIASSDPSGFMDKIRMIIKTFRVAKSGYSIAYFNLSSPSAVFKYPLICRLAGMKQIVFHSHNSLDDKVGILHNIINAIGRVYINHIETMRFACSSKAARWLYGGRVAKDPTKYTLINNGLEIKDYRFNKAVRQRIREYYSIADDEIVIGHVGRFEKQKNHRFLIDVFNKFHESNSNSILMLIGIGSLMDDVKKQVHLLGLDNSVLFIGETPKVNEYLQAMDLFLLPSLYEGLPVVGIEAQATGLKCIFSDTITAESDISGNIKYLPLNKGPRYWKDYLSTIQPYKRLDMSEKVKSSGYDMSEIAKIVENELDKIV